MRVEVLPPGVAPAAAQLSLALVLQGPAEPPHARPDVPPGLAVDLELVPGKGLAAEPARMVLFGLSAAVLIELLLNYY